MWKIGILMAGVIFQMSSAFGNMLHEAIRGDNIAEVRRLLSSNHIADLINEVEADSGMTPLLLSIQLSNVEIFKLLIKSEKLSFGSRINGSPREVKPLLFALETARQYKNLNSYQIVSLLLDEIILEREKASRRIYSKSDKGILLAFTNVMGSKIQTEIGREIARKIEVITTKYHLSREKDKDWARSRVLDRKQVKEAVESVDESGQLRPGSKVERTVTPYYVRRVYRPSARGSTIRASLQRRPSRGLVNRASPPISRPTSPNVPSIRDQGQLQAQQRRSPGLSRPASPTVSIPRESSLQDVPTPNLLENSRGIKSAFDFSVLLEPFPAPLSPSQGRSSNKPTRAGRGRRLEFISARSERSLSRESVAREESKDVVRRASFRRRSPSRDSAAQKQSNDGSQFKGSPEAVQALLALDTSVKKVSDPELLFRENDNGPSEGKLRGFLNTDRTISPIRKKIDALIRNQDFIKNVENCISVEIQKKEALIKNQKDVFIEKTTTNFESFKNNKSCENLAFDTVEKLADVFETVENTKEKKAIRELRSFLNQTVEIIQQKHKNKEIHWLKQRVVSLIFLKWILPRLIGKASDRLMALRDEDPDMRNKRNHPTLLKYTRISKFYSHFLHAASRTFNGNETFVGFAKELDLFQEVLFGE